MTRPCQRLTSHWHPCIGNANRIRSLPTANDSNSCSHGCCPLVRHVQRRRRPLAGQPCIDSAVTAIHCSSFASFLNPLRPYCVFLSLQCDTSRPIVVVGSGPHGVACSLGTFCIAHSGPLHFITMTCTSFPVSAPAGAAAGRHANCAARASSLGSPQAPRTLHTHRKVSLLGAAPAIGDGR